MLEKEIKLIYNLDRRCTIATQRPTSHPFRNDFSAARFIEGRKDDLQFKKHCMVSKRTDLSNFFLNDKVLSIDTLYKDCKEVHCPWN
jgi:hypothetical protein